MWVKKQRLELDMKQYEQTGSKLEKEYDKV